MVMDKRGFTLVEVLIAVSITLVGILGSLVLILYSQLTAQVAKQKTLAGFIAQSQLSLIQAAPLEYYPAWFDDNALRIVDSVKEPDLSLCKSWQISATVVSPGVKLYRVTLRLIMENGNQETFVTYATPK
jgi:prepilin-type N-terminal cleavage/methylation domain-containing protein